MILLRTGGGSRYQLLWSSRRLANLATSWAKVFAALPIQIFLSCSLNWPSPIWLPSPHVVHQPIGLGQLDSGLY
ncbi:protein-tyrosine-phosphatase [Sesbania bispinosa]|nr:protein-tyrosine-phosphatase [Sesbania bispinosa]